MLRIRRIGGPLAVALTSTLLLGSSAAPAATGQPSAACIREGLAPIPVTLRAGAAHIGRAGIPIFQVAWSGRPLAAGCGARRTVAVDFTMWFPHLRFVYTEGFPTNWLQFWGGTRAVHDERERYAGPIYNPLECIIKARAKLRYQVVAPSGKVLGRRIVPAPVKLPACSE